MALMTILSFVQNLLASRNGIATPVEIVQLHLSLGASTTTTDYYGSIIRDNLTGMFGSHLELLALCELFHLEFRLMSDIKLFKVLYGNICENLKFTNIHRFVSWQILNSHQ